MKQFIAGVVAGALATCGAGLAATVVDHNGAFWNQLSAPVKVGYMDGYGDAMRVSVGKLDSLKIAAELFHWKGANKILGQIARELSTGALTPDAAVQQLDAFYSNPKYGELDLGQALEFLAVRNPAPASSNADAAAPNSANPPADGPPNPAAAH